MFARAVLVWLVLLSLAVANGALREGLLSPRIGSGGGHAVSTILLSALILLVGWVTVPWIGPRSIQESWLVGLTWMGLTVAFEFLGGHFLFGRSWALLFADYNLLAGRIWVMVLIVSLITPVVAYTRRGSVPAASSIFLQR